MTFPSGRRVMTRRFSSSRLRNAPIIFMEKVRSSFSKCPHGKSLLCSLITCRIRVAGIPIARNRSGRSWTWITDCRSPTRLALLIPSIFSRRSFILRAWISSVSWETSPLRANETMGMSRTELSTILGFKASLGRSASAAATLRFNNCMASARGISALKLTAIRDISSRDALTICFNPFIPLSCFSIFWVISFSTRSGEAPGHVVVTDACGISRSGRDSLIMEE